MGTGGRRLASVSCQGWRVIRKAALPARSGRLARYLWAMALRPRWI